MVFVPESVLCQKPEQTYQEIRSVLDTARPDDDTWYPRWWAADALTLMGQYDAAIAIHPPPTSLRAVMQTERLLSLKVVAGVPYSATNLLALLGPRITTYGQENIDQVRRAAKFLVEGDDVTRRLARLREWAAQSPARPYSVYIGSSAGYRASKNLALTHHEFSKSSECVEYCRDIARQAENMVREDAGLPRVGEGWLSETRLFYELRDAFPHLEVHQHASPQWLGRQHLDVYIPELAIGVEFQGVQHDGPVEFFGGAEAYEAVKKRDIRKLRLCKRHGVRLIYVRPGYELQLVIDEILGVR